MAQHNERIPSNSVEDLLTEQLVAFTDRILDKEGSQEEGSELSDSDLELRGLQEMALLLKRASVEPGPGTARQIRERLLAEWRTREVPVVVGRNGEAVQGKAGRQAAPMRQNWWQRLRRGIPAASPRQFALGFAMAAAVLVAVVLILPQDVTHLPATALGGVSLLPVGITVTVVLVVATYWLLRDRR